MAVKGIIQSHENSFANLTHSLIVIALAMGNPVPQTPPAAYKRHKSRKAPAIKTAVIVQRAQGKAKSHIARDLGITHNTVNVILEESDIERHLSANQAASLSLIPAAIRAAHVRLKMNSETMAIKVLENTIWPLNGKTGKANDAGLTLAIQNLLLGPTQVNNSVAPASSTAISSGENADNPAPHDNSIVTNKP